LWSVVAAACVYCILRGRKEEKEGGEGRRRRKEEDHGGFYTTFKSVIFARLSRIFQAHLLDTQTYLFLE
jgi:hypothetical protein